MQFARRVMGISIALTITLVCWAQEGPKAPKNLGLEEGELGKTPAGWFFPEPCVTDGYTLKLSDEKPFAGKRCAVLSRNSDKAPEAFGNILQSIDATNYRGKRIRFKAAVRADVTGDGNQARLWLRVDTPGGMGFFDNMGDRAITTKEWRHYEIVGDIAGDAESITFGMLLIGNGTAALDDGSFDVVDPKTKTTAVPDRPKPEPGLVEVVMAEAINARDGADTGTLLYPLPLAYRDQVPLTFHLNVEPGAAGKSIEIVEGPGENRILKLTLQDLAKHKKVDVTFRSTVLVAPTKFDRVPKRVSFPNEWPDEAKPWLTSTWCVDFENEQVAKFAKDVRGDGDEIMSTINGALTRCRKVFDNAKGHVNNLTSVEALAKQGSCTSCANLVAAALRGSGIPARVLAGYPLWSGPLQTHYIVEAYVPGYGWYPLESTACQSGWPNYQQINVSIIPIEYESREKAKMRPFAAGGVPYLSLTECAEPPKNYWTVGTIKQYCDHEAKMIRAMQADDSQWTEAMAWAKPRWAAWLKSSPTIENGRVTFGPSPDQVKAVSPAELVRELK